ncbi:MAG: HEAT repeat domain-containing protein [Myxococcales bacterium]|nr:HEAT repeat domain-containing protein [Myxococcales bacterium]
MQVLKSKKKSTFKQLLYCGSLFCLGPLVVVGCSQTRVIKSKRSPVFDLIRQLRASESEKRIEAAQKLGELGPSAKQAIPTLRSSLEDPSVEVRKASLRALMMMGERGVPSWLRGLDDKSSDVRKMIEDKLDEGGDEMVTSVSKVLQSPIEEERRLAVRALGHMSKRSPKAIPVLGRAVLDSEVDVRQEAAETLGKIGSKSSPAVPQLVKGLQQNRDWWKVRKAIIEALGSIGSGAAEAIPSLVEMMQDKDDDVRKAALSAIRNIGPSAVQALSDALPASTWWAKAEILKMLNTFGVKAKAALPALIALLSDNDEDVRRRAAIIIGKFGTEGSSAAPALQKILFDQKAPQVLWIVAMESLMKIGPDGNAVLRKALDSNDWWLPKAISEAFGQSGADTALEAIPTLEYALQHKRWEVRWTVALVAGRMKAKAAPLIPALLKALRDKETRVQVQAALSLGEMGKAAKSAITPLQSIRNAGGLERQAAIKKALEKLEGAQ